jgi:hypothetical protein
MEIRLTLTPEDEKLAKEIASKQETSKRDAVISVFRKTGKNFTKKKLPNFSSTQWGRSKSSPSKTAK